MSLPDHAPARKPNRLGLYLPFVLLLLGVIAWSGYWLWLRSEARIRLDAGVEDLRRAGYEVSWSDRALGGYPFRLDVSLKDARVRDPSGWALAAPQLEAEAFAHAPTRWILAAPQGVTFTRPRGGPVRVTGKLIRASVSHFEKTPPSFSFEGVGLTFAPETGAEPFALTAAERVEMHLRAGPDDEGLLAVDMDKGQARLSGLFARIAGEKPISILWQSTLTHMSAFRGASWPEAVRAWTAGGGQIRLRQAGLSAGEATVGSQSGTFTVGSDGRLQGAMDVTLRQAPRALSAMGDTGVIPPESAQAASAMAQARQGQGDLARATITFQAGQTTLGPVAIGPAPRVY